MSSMTEQIYMVIAPEGWGTGTTRQDAQEVCARHIPEEILPPGGKCRLQVLLVPPGAEMDNFCLRITWPEENDPDRHGTRIVGYVEVTLDEDEKGWLSHRFSDMEAASP